VCSAVISCRFDDGSMEMCALGRILEERRGEEFEPYFLVRPDMESHDLSFKVTITMDVIRGMTDSAVFGLPNIYIPLKDSTKATSINLFLTAHDGLEPDGFPISGYPRVILGEPAAQPRRPTKGGSEPKLRPHVAKHSKTVSDVDSISLNGPTLHGPSGSISRSTSSEDSWQETQAKMAAYHAKDGRPKMSLADLIAQHQGTGTSIRNRTNRFWTYIGNNHMAQHPEMYSADELAKFAANTTARPAEVDGAPVIGEPAPPYVTSPTPTSGTFSSNGSGSHHTAMTIQPGVHELEARHKGANGGADQDSHERHDSGGAQGPAYTHRALPHRDRQNVHSWSGTDFEEDPEAATYNAQEVQIQIASASPVVQVRNRDSINSVLSLYASGSMY
jgi:hypothetical protein